MDVLECSTGEDERHEFKKAKYTDLVAECTSNGWKVHFFPQGSPEFKENPFFEICQFFFKSYLKVLLHVRQAMRQIAIYSLEHDPWFLTLTLDVGEYPSTTLDSCPKLSKISLKKTGLPMHFLPYNGSKFQSGKSGLQEVFNMIKGKQDLGLFLVVGILTIRKSRMHNRSGKHIIASILNDLKINLQLWP